MDRRRWRARLRTVLTVALLLFVVVGFTACSLSLPGGAPAGETDPVDDTRGSGPPGGDEPAPDPDPQPDPDPEPDPDPDPAPDPEPDPDPDPEPDPDPDPEPDPDPDPEPHPDPDPEFGATAMRLLELVNEARAEARSCGARGWFDATHPLALEARLVRAAQGHSDDMNANGFFSHTGSDGSSPPDRVTREGYVWAAVGETIARGQSTPERVVDAWLASDGHCAILMSTRYTELGAGEASRYWTLVFARPR